MVENKDNFCMSQFLHLPVNNFDNHVLLCLYQEKVSGDTVEETEVSLEDLMAQMRKL